MENEQTDIIQQLTPKKRLPQWSVVLMLLGAMLLLIIGIIKVAVEQQAFVNECNAHWLKQIEVAYPKTNYPWQEWNATPTGLSQGIADVAEKAGLHSSDSSSLASSVDSSSST